MQLYSVGTLRPATTASMRHFWHGRLAPLLDGNSQEEGRESSSERSLNTAHLKDVITRSLVDYGWTAIGIVFVLGTLAPSLSPRSSCAMRDLGPTYLIAGL